MASERFEMTGQEVMLPDGRKGWCEELNLVDMTPVFSRVEKVKQVIKRNVDGVLRREENKVKIN